MVFILRHLTKDEIILEGLTTGNNAALDVKEGGIAGCGVLPLPTSQKEVGSASTKPPGYSILQKRLQLKRIRKMKRAATSCIIKMKRAATSWI